MAGNARQLSVEELEDRFRSARDVVERSHCQAIWLLAKGHSTAEVAEIVALTPRWIRGETPLGAWLRGLLERAHPNVVVVALAAKLARIAWAVLRNGTDYDRRVAAA